MDMFMDKLAQKLNAQEIIKANTSADTEEMNHLKGQLAAYEECLKKLQKMIDDGTNKFQEMSVNGNELNRIVETAIEKMQANGNDQEQTQNIESIKVLQGDIKTQMDEMKLELDALISALEVPDEEVQDDEMEERFAVLNDSVHKECVKVYRNVQAVVVEEGSKQKENLSLVSEAVSSLNGKLSAVLGISIAALIFSLAGVVLQVLNMLGFSLF